MHIIYPFTAERWHQFIELRESRRPICIAGDLAVISELSARGWTIRVALQIFSDQVKNMRLPPRHVPKTKSAPKK